MKSKSSMSKSKIKNVVSLNGAQIKSDRRASFIQTVAMSYDRYIKAYGEQPDAIVLILGGIKQTSQIGWDVEGESQQGMTSLLALAGMHCLAEAQSEYEPID